MSAQGKSTDPGFAMLGSVFHQYATFRREHRDRRIQLCKAVVDRWAAWKRKDLEHQRLTSESFRPLSLITIRETNHSLLLGELLNPEGGHGQGRLFLESFLERIGIDNPAAGNWSVTIEAGRVDILLRRSEPASVVIIENKPHDAVDQPNQLYRYWLQEIHEEHPQLDYEAAKTQSQFKVLFLPSEKYRTPTKESLSRPAGLEINSTLPGQMPLPVDILPYAHDMADWLEAAIEQVPAENVRLRTFLQFYLENWRNR